MDPQTYSFVLGAFVSLVATLGATWLNHRFTLRREKDQWERQQTEDDKKWNREVSKQESDRQYEEQTQQREFVRQLYQRIVQGLSSLLAMSDDDSPTKLTDEQRVDKTEDILKSGSALMLQRPEVFDQKSAFYKALEDFTQWPTSEHYIDQLRTVTIKLAEQDKELFPDRQTLVVEAKDENERIFNFEIDEGFRRDQLIDGVQLPPRSSFPLSLLLLTKEQRRKLVDLYFESHHNIPDQVRLVLLKRNVETGQIQQVNWEAKLNSLTDAPTQILTAWEADYDSSVKDVKEVQQSVP